MSKFDYVLKYNISAVAIQPLHIGASDGSTDILVDNVSNKPYIQANSISGSFGDYATKKFGKINKQMLFGSANGSDSKSNIVFTDADLYNYKSEIRPRVSIDGETATSKAGAYFEIKILGAGTKVYFEIFVFAKEKNLDNYKNYCENMIAGFNNGEILLGGQKSNGCGVCKVEKVEYKKYELKTEKGLEEWLDSEKTVYEDITSEIKSLDAGLFYNIEMSAKTIDALIVKSKATLEMYNEKFVDSESIKNAEGKFIIPGSSIKGLFRSHIYTMGGYMNINEEILNEFFGRGTSEGDLGINGKVYFYDGVIEDEKSKLVHRIKIDKFTGGTFNGGKFDEKPVGGKFKLNIKVENKENCKAIIGLLLLALRDLSCGVISLGGLASIGRGFVEGDEIVVKYSNKNVAEIDANNGKIKVGIDFVKECMSELGKLKNSKEVTE